ncbi:hypothetical protein MesoLj131c_22620 [Mesorhizobium sp. 131-3-5]|nr:hypothetical protein MesoLj131c_22620 [Mesorhizobium sp. 131-3-5]
MITALSTAYRKLVLSQERLSAQAPAKAEIGSAGQRHPNAHAKAECKAHEQLAGKAISMARKGATWRSEGL